MHCLYNVIIVENKFQFNSIQYTQYTMCNEYDGCNVCNGYICVYNIYIYNIYIYIYIYVYIYIYIYNVHMNV